MTADDSGEPLFTSENVEQPVNLDDAYLVVGVDVTGGLRVYVNDDGVDRGTFVSLRLTLRTLGPAGLADDDDDPLIVNAIFHDMAHAQAVAAALTAATVAVAEL